MGLPSLLWKKKQRHEEEHLFTQGPNTISPHYCWNESLWVTGWEGRSRQDGVQGVWAEKLSRVEGKSLVEGESISPLDTLGWRKLLDNQTDKWNGQLVGVPEGAETLAGGGSFTWRWCLRTSQSNRVTQLCRLHDTRYWKWCHTPA